MKILCNEKSQVLAGKTALATGLELVATDFKKFPDGELYLKTGKTDEETVIISSVTDSDSFIQTLLLADACEDSEVTLVLPYMGYARQDKRFNEGEAISARAIARALSEGVSRVYTINTHETDNLSFFRVPAEDLSLAPYMGEYIKTLGLDDPLILAPDAGAAVFAKSVAEKVHFDCDHLSKTRHSGTEVTMQPKELDASGRSVVIVDDIISTGGTLATASKMLMMQGAVSVHAACVHGVFSGGGYAKLYSAGVKSIVSSDTIESASSRISAAECIKNAVLS
ncbi:ribose-phosphate pyrophosphokinase [Methanomicrobium sp. W14]|jgi:ribose-phosphate pyrophosphokinase|uniref:ribose-phosphate diphosphokinase n=1 Tax=Methanomicrobium sp. W14 TaxID=2817839 RepID=UPI001AE25BFE|nr:ribose-phosphate diphosphokinase [Methanomicrobium sp. W14]MBP2133606.1 ribose-phosphate pyrophosphokinase [Methanomicrobium sp. W14]